MRFSRLWWRASRTWKKMETRKRKLDGWSQYGLRLGGTEVEGVLRSDDRHGKSCLLQTASKSQGREVRRVLARANAKATVSVSNGFLIVGAVAQRGLHVSDAALGALASHDRNCDHSTDEADVQDKGDTGEERDAADAEGQDAATDRIECRGAGDTLDGLYPARDGLVMIGQDSQEIGEDTEDDGRGTELQEADGLVDDAQEDTADAHVGGVLRPQPGKGVNGSSVDEWIRHRDRNLLVRGVDQTEGPDAGDRTRGRRTGREEQSRREDQARGGDEYIAGDDGGMLVGSARAISGESRASVERPTRPAAVARGPKWEVVVRGLGWQHSVPAKYQ